MGLFRRKDVIWPGKCHSAKYSGSKRQDKPPQRRNQYDGKMLNQGLVLNPPLIPNTKMEDRWPTP
jgi:hypothetical protein